MSLPTWFRLCFSLQTRQIVKNRKRRLRPIEELESRLTPATLYWLGAVDTNWNTLGNWGTSISSGPVSDPGTVPATNDQIFFDTTATGFNDILASFTVNNNIAGLTGLSLTINDASPTGDFNIAGSAIATGAGGIISAVSNGTSATLGFATTGITLGAAQSFVNNSGNLIVNSAVANGGNLLTIDGAGITTLGGSITGIGGLTHTGTDKLILTATNFYSGGTTIDSGANLQIGNGGTAGTIVYASAITNNGTLTFNRSDAITPGNSFAINGAGNVVQAGAGTTTLSADSNYSGTTTLNAGVLQGRNPNLTDILQAFGTSTLILNAGTLQLRGNGTGSDKILAAGNNVVINGPVTIDTNNNGGNIQNIYAFGTLAIGSSTLTMTGSNIFGISFTTVTVSGNATFNPSNNSAFIRIGNLTVSDTVADNSTTTVTITGPSETQNGRYPAITGVASDYSPTRKLAILKSGGSRWYFNGNNTFSGGLTVDAGTLDIAVSSLISGTLTLNAGTLIGRNADGAEAALNAFGTTTLALNGGTVQLKANSSSATNIVTPNNVIVGGNVSIDSSNNGSQSSRTFVLGTLSIGAYTLNVTGGSSYGLRFGAATATGNATFNPTSSSLTLASLTVGDAVAPASTTTVTLGGTRDSSTITGAITDNVNDPSKRLAISKTNTSVWNFNGVNTFSGGFEITAGTVTATTTTGATFQAIGTGLLTLGGGTLNLRSNGAGNNGTIAAGNDVVVTNNATLNINNSSGNSGNTFAFGALTIGSNVQGLNTFTISGGSSYAASFTSTALNGNATLNNSVTANPGPITEAGGARILTKAGSGTLTLNGTNIYSGGTIINAGSITVGAASTLGSDVVGNNVTVIGEGRLTLNAVSNMGANQTFGFKTLPAPTAANVNGAVPVLTINHTGALPTYSGELAAGVVALGVNYATALDQSLFGNSYLGAASGVNYSAATLSPGSDGVYRLGGGGSTLTLTNTAAVLTGASKTLVVGVLGYNGSGSAGGTGTVVLQGANDFTGATTVNPGSTLTLSGASGAIASSSSITVIGGTLSIDNNSPAATGNNNDRIGDSTAIELNRATFTMNTNANVNSTEAIGTLKFVVNATVTLNSNTNRVTTFNPTAIERSGSATGLVRGLNLGGNGQPSNYSRLLLGSFTGLNQVGTLTANTSNGIGTDKNLKITPWLLADAALAGTGSNFATYDIGAIGGLRPLSASETVTFASRTPLATDENIKDTSSSAPPTFSGTTTVNSIVLAPTTGLSYTGSAGAVLASTSGGLALITNFTVGLPTFDSLNIGTTEAIILATTGTLNLNSSVNPTLNIALTKGGSGTLTSTGAKTFTGAIVVNSGTLNMNGSSTQSSSTVNGGNLQVDGTNGNSSTSTGALGSSSASITVNSGGTLTYANASSSTATAFGGGDIALNSGGTISMSGGGGGSISTFTNRVVVTGNGFITQNSGGGSGNKTLFGPITMNANAMLTTRRENSSTNGLGSGAVTLNGDATFNTIANSADSNHPFNIPSISGNFSITKRGTAELWIAHKDFVNVNVVAAASTYTGNTNIEQGPIRIGMNNALPTTTTVAVNAGGTLDLSTGNFEVSIGNFSQTVAGLIDGSSGAGSVIADSQGATAAQTLILGGAGTYSFTGLLRDRSSTSTASLALVKTGTGQQTLSGNNSYTGYTSIQAGVLQVARNSPSGGPGPLGSAVTAVDLGAIRLQDAVVATVGNISLSGTQTIDGVAVVAGNRVLVKNQTTASQNGLYVVASGAWSRSTDLDAAAEFKYGNTVTVTSGNTQSGTYYSAILSPAVADPLWTFGTPANTASLLTSAAVTIGRNIAVNFTSVGGISTLGGMHTSGTSQFTGTITLGQTSNNAGSIFARDLTLTSASGGTVEFTGVLSDPVGLVGSPGILTKSGAGNATFSGANTYAGATSVAAGKLSINNTTGAGAVTVDASGTLGGVGTISGPVTVNGTIAPGNSIGALTINNTVSIGGVNDFEVTPGSGLNGSADKVISTGALTYGGVLKISPLAPTGYASGDSWDLFNSASQVGIFANNAVFDTSGDGVNLPSLSSTLNWKFDYTTGVLSIVTAIAAPTVASIVPAIGPTTGGTLVNINGSNFVSITSVTFDGIALATFSVSGTTQITVTTDAHVAGAVDVVVTNASGSSSLIGTSDFTYAAPAVTSVVVNGGPGVVLGGSTWSLTGQNSVVKQLLVTFNQAVTLATDAFTITPVPVNPLGGPGVVVVNGGATPSSAAVTASIAATLSPSSYLITFSGPGTHGGGVINSGVYDLNTLASKVSANGATMASDQTSTFFAMFGNIQANNIYAGETFTTPIPPGYASGDGLTNAFVDPGSLFRFSDAFGSSAAAPVGPPAYDIIFDSNLDGFVDPGDLFAFSDSFGIDWDF